MDKKNNVQYYMPICIICLHLVYRYSEQFLSMSVSTLSISLSDSQSVS